MLLLQSTLYQTLREWANANGFRNILSGTNSDDLGDTDQDWTPQNSLVLLHPYAQNGITKAQVRALARHFGLPIADKPASPCLASRIAYGQEVTRERLRLIEGGEEIASSIGFSRCSRSSARRQFSSIGASRVRLVLTRRTLRSKQRFVSISWRQELTS